MSASSGEIRSRRAAQMRGILMALLLVGLSAFAAGASDVDQIHERWVWSVSGTSVGDGGLHIVDFDGDGRFEILATADSDNCCGHSRYWHLSRYDGELERIWTSFSLQDDLLGLEVANRDLDPEIALLTPGSVLIFAPYERVVARMIPIDTDSPTAFAVGDLDGQGGLEMVVCGYDDLWTYDYETGSQISVKNGFGCRDIDLGQIDTDPALEIAIAGNSAGGFILDGSSLAVDWARPEGFGTHVVLADLDNDPQDEVLAEDSGTGRVRAWDPATNFMLWQTNASSGVLLLESSDLDSDGVEEVMVMNTDGQLRVYDGRFGVLNWFASTSLYEPTGAVVADLDGDSVMEIFLGSGGYSANDSPWIVIDADSHEVESYGLPFFGSFPAFSLAGPNGGQGSSSLVSATHRAENGLHGISEVRFDLRAKRIEYVGPLLRTSFSTISKSVTAQLDSDPSLEVCLSYEDYPYRGVVHCEDASTHELEWEVELPEYEGITSLTVAELDGDAYPEVLAGTYANFVYAFEGESGWLKWRTPGIVSTGSDFSVIRVADVVGDPLPEVIAGGGWWTYPPPDLAIFDAATGALEFGPYPVAAPSFDTLARAGSTDAIYIGTTTGDLAQLDPETGALSPPIYGFGAPIWALRTGDVNRDGVSDFVMAVDGQVHVYGGAESSILWSSPFIDDGAGLDDSLFLEDVGANAVPDILVNTNSGFAWFEGPLFTLLVDGFESGDTSAWSSTIP